MDYLHWWPTGLDVPQFLDAFWPNFAATLLGAALGIPAGLYISRRAERTAAARDDDDRTKVALALVRFFESNVPAAEMAAKLLMVDKGTVLLSGLDLEGWDILRPDFMRLVRDVDIKSRVAMLVATLRQAREATLFHREVTVGPAAALSSATATRGAARVAAAGKSLEYIKRFHDLYPDLWVLAGQSLEHPKFEPWVARLAASAQGTGDGGADSPGSAVGESLDVDAL